MKTLLTGRSGFLGKYILNHLNTLGQEVYSIGRGKSNDFIADLTNDFLLIPEDTNTVIHAAGLAHRKKKHKNDFKDFMNVNLEGTKNLLNTLTNFNIENFVFISSVAVYGNYKGLDIHENSPLLAKDPYGKSKILAEEIILKWALKKKVKVSILRLPLVVGNNPKGNLMDMINAINKGFYFHIDGGKAKKSMVLAEDVAKIIPIVSEIGGIFNLTDGYHPSFKELSNLISLQLGKPQCKNLPYLFAKLLSIFGDAFGDKFPINSNKLIKIISSLTFNDNKARQLLGWNPTPILNGFKIDSNFR